MEKIHYKTLLMDMLQDDDDDDDDEMEIIKLLINTNGTVGHQRVRKKPMIGNSKSYYEEIKRFNLDDFSKHFKMTRYAFEELINLTGKYFKKRLVVPVEKRLLLTVWLLINRVTFAATGNKFGLATSTTHLIFSEGVRIFRNLMETFVKFPKSKRLSRIAKAFEQKYQLPGIVGAINTCHINIKQIPEMNTKYFCNKDGYPSIVLQGICDHQLAFIDVNIGMPGEVVNADVFKNSPIYTKLIDKKPIIAAHQHLIGDNTYNNFDFLLTPYKDSGSLSDAQKRFNYKLHSACQTIDQAFTLLKDNFDRLNYIDVDSHEIANEIIAACCVLHNFIIEKDGAPKLDSTHCYDDEDIIEYSDSLENIIETDKRLLYSKIFE